MKVIYCHGLGSIGLTPKTKALIDHFGEGNVVAPNLPINPSESEDIIDTIVKENTNYPLIFCGTSLGGFWANYSAQKWDAPCVIINPAGKPSVKLRHFIDNPVNNYYTGEPVIITEYDLDQYARREKFLAEHTNGKLINLFVSKNDLILPYEETLQEYPSRDFVSIQEDGGHIMEMHWPKVIHRIEELTGK